MKKAGVIAASVASAASSMALASKSDRYVAISHDYYEDLGSSKRKDGLGSKRDGENEKFAPRFDGLRFIETLVTAHR